MFSLFKNTHSPITRFTPVNTGFKAKPLSWGDGIICQVKDFCGYPENATKEQHEEVYAQLRKLSRSLSGFKEACELYIGGAYFGEERMVKRATKFLTAYLDSHLELTDAELELCLDCINIGERMAVNGAWLREYVARILPTTDNEQLHDYARRLYVIG